MKHSSTLLKTAIFILTLIGSGSVMAEGTKELMPDSIGNKSAKILIANGNVGGATRDPFALYNGARVYALFVHISDSSREKIYLGLGASSGSVVNLRVHKPDGSVEWLGATPTSGQPGYITYFSQAYAGPKKINPTKGYNPIVVAPKVNGDYFITFEVGPNDSRTYDKIDVTVIDTVTSTPKPGRLFSKAWQLNTNDNPGNHGFWGRLYIYSNDGVVSRLDPNGMQGMWFTISCNESGCYPIDPLHNAQQARQSVNGWHNYPQFKIFLNDPDILVYPSGTIGQLVPNSLSTVFNCLSGTIDFIFQTTAQGSVEIKLELSALGGGFVDRILVQNVTGGIDTITWDGLDGNGLPVPSGSIFPFTLTFINGLTNLPLWDVENNVDGFKVNLVRPQSIPIIPDPNFYWDDSQLGGGININPPGCTSSPTSGCHTWTSDWGDLRTINTWWYVVSTSTVPVAIQFKKGPQPLGIISGPNTVCPGSSNFYSVPTDPNSTGYHWIYPGGEDTTIFPNITFTFPITTPPGPAVIQVNGINPLCGAGPVSSLTVTVKPIPVVTTAPLNKTICSNSLTSIGLTANIAGSTFAWLPRSTPPPVITGYNPGAGLTINDVLVNTGVIPGIVNYRIIPTANGCAGDSVNFLVTVNPNPAVSNATTTFSICSGSITNIPLTGTVAGTTFTWTATGSAGSVSGYSASAGPVIAQTLVNSGFTVETVTYNVTPTANGCIGQAKSFVVTVYPVPDLTNVPLSKSQCDNVNTAIALTSNVAGAKFTWTCLPSSANITGYANNPLPASSISQVLDNTGFNIETVTYIISPIANGCPGPTYNFVVTVNPTPDISNSPLAKSQCDNQNTNIILTSNVAGTLFTWNCVPSSGNITGWANNAVPAGSIGQTLDNTGFLTETVTYKLTPVANGCNGTMADYTVTVFPTPNLSNSPAAQTQCDNVATNIILTSNVAATQFTWTCTPSSGNITGWSNNAVPSIALNQTLDNTGFNIETVTYHITPTANGCNGTVTDFVVTVNPTPDLSNLPLSKSQCDNLPTGITLTSNVAGTQFTWTCSPSSANITGFSNNGVPTTTLNQTLDNTGFTTESVVYHISPGANACTGSVTDFTVNVFPSPDLSNAPASKSQCDNLPTGINLTSNVAGTQFTWTCTPSTGSITGWSNNAIPTITLNQTLDNTGFNIETVTYHLSPNANGCTGNIADYVVTVFPTPDLSNMPKSMQVCNNSSPNLALTSNVAGALFTWTCTPSSANVTGWSNNAVPTGLLNQTLSNSGLNIETVIYHMTPQANGCTGPVTDYTVTVVQTPDVFFNPASQTICSLQSTLIQVLSSVPLTTFAWTVTASSPNLTGQTAGAGNVITQTITNSGNTIETLTYHVTPTAWGCPPGNTMNVIVTVNPRPAVTNPVLTSQICSAGMTGIALLSSVAGSTFTWTSSGSSGNVTGYSNGAGMSIIQSLTNTGFNLETVIYGVTPIANGCPGNVTNFTVTVFPVPNVIFTPAAQVFCSGSVTGLNLSSGVAGASYTWIANGSSGNVGGFSPGAGPLIQQVLTNSSFNVETVTYIASPSANGCPGINNSAIVTVNPLPVVNYPVCFDQVVTTTSKPIDLKGATPLGGIYSGAGVSAGQFLPGLAGPGLHVITYTYTNTYGCTRNATQNINVINPIPIVCGNMVTDVRDNQAYPTVALGAQCWMASNLNYGNTIASALMQADNCINEKYCYSDNPANCLTDGGLYQWDETMKYTALNGAQGFCPPDWHIPTENDWMTLFTFYISNGFAGSPLKYTGYSGFNAFLTGVRFNNVQFDFSNFAVLFWSSASHGPRKAWAHGMNSFNPSVSYYPSHRNNAFPVRCIHD
jgi:uncharacterized protein (TIGR02145 family)